VWNIRSKWIRDEHRLPNAREELERLWKERISNVQAKATGAGAGAAGKEDGKLHFFSEIFLDSENFLRKSQIFRLHFLRKSTSYLRKCNLVFFSLGARFRITNYASENYF
jgi:hypothetical protein